MGCPHVQATYMYHIRTTAGSMLTTKYPHMRAPYGHKNTRMCGLQATQAARTYGFHTCTKQPDERAALGPRVPACAGKPSLSLPAGAGACWHELPAHAGKSLVCNCPQMREVRGASIARMCGCLLHVSCPHVRALYAACSPHMRAVRYSMLPAYAGKQWPSALMPARAGAW